MTAAVAGPSGTPSAGGTKRASGEETVLGSPMKRIMRAADMCFTNRYHLLLYVFKPAAKKLGANGPTMVASPLYTFNPGHVGQYLSLQDLGFINNLSNGGAAVFVNNIKGSVKMVGINAPFVANTEGQAATNSGAILAASTGTGLERMHEMIQGQVTIDDTTTKVTNWVKDNQNSGYDWQSKLEITTANNLNDTVWQEVTTMADRNFVEYTCTSNTLNASQLNEVISEPLLGRAMSPMLITDAKGEIISWDHDMNMCALSVPDLLNTNMQVDNLKASIATDQLISTTAGTVSNVAGLLQSPSPNKNMYLSHHNVYQMGDVGCKHQELPPKEYLQLVPPPTITQGSIQDMFVQVILDVEMSVRIERDRIMLNNKLQGNRLSYICKPKFLGDSQSHYNGNCATSA